MVTGVKMVVHAADYWEKKSSSLVDMSSAQMMWVGKNQQGTCIGVATKVEMGYLDLRTKTWDLGTPEIRNDWVAETLWTNDQYC